MKAKRLSRKKKEMAGSKELCTLKMKIRIKWVRPRKQTTLSQETQNSQFGVYFFISQKFTEKMLCAQVLQIHTHTHTLSYVYISKYVQGKKMSKW